MDGVLRIRELENTRKCNDLVCNINDPTTIAAMFYPPCFFMYIVSAQWSTEAPGPWLDLFRLLFTYENLYDNNS